MADVRSLPGLRFADVAELAALVAPPYDVITPEAQLRYYARHEHNIIRLELGREEPADDELDNRYTRAAMTFASWRLAHVLRQDPPSLYLYEQQFTADGAARTRTSLLARVRLEPWEARVVLPHERTLSKPKDDRLKLVRASAANLSPVLALYDDPRGELAKRFTRPRSAPPAVDFRDEASERHRLWAIEDAVLAAHVSAFFGDRQLYIADGHHRYETALAYRDEVRELRRELLADDAANFVLMALTAVEDPGLVVLPTHRLVSGVSQERLDQLEATLAHYFALEPVPASDFADLPARLRAAASANGTPAFVVAQRGGAQVLRLLPAGQKAMREAGATAGGEAHSDAWRALDVAVLHELVVARALGITSDAVAAGDNVRYTRDADAALAAVHGGEAQVALLLGPTPAKAMRDVARAGDRMPQKSTYFYPKLITGLVINPLW
jgi:uncharacterized protein (DUF1015 family)